MDEENRIGTIPSGFGKRLREERERLNFTQVELSKLAGLGRLTQIAYENETASPRTTYLSAVATVGVDILYLLLGIRQHDLVATTDDEIVAKAFDMVEAYAATQANGHLSAESRQLLFQISRKSLTLVKLGILPQTFNPLTIHPSTVITR